MYTATATLISVPTCVMTVFVGQVVTQRTVRDLAVQIVLIPASIAGHLGPLLTSPLPEVGSQESRKFLSTSTDSYWWWSSIMNTTTGVAVRNPILRPEGEG